MHFLQEKGSEIQRSKTNLDHGINRKYREKHQEVCRYLERSRFITTNSWWRFCQHGNVLPLNLSCGVPKPSQTCVKTDPSKQEKDSKKDRMNLGSTFLEGSITKLSRLFRPLLIYKLSKMKKYFSPKTLARNTMHCFWKLAVMNLKTLPHCKSLKPS